MGAGRLGKCLDFSTLLSNHKRKELLPNPGVAPPHPGQGPALAPLPHLTLQLTLLLEAEVFRGVSHHGEGLLGVVSAGQKTTQ